MYDLKFSEEEILKAFSVQEVITTNLKKLKKTFKTDCMSYFDHVIDNGLHQIIDTIYLTNVDDGGRMRISSPNSIPKPGDTPPVTVSYFKLPVEHMANITTHIKIKNIDPNELYVFLENLSMCYNAQIVPMTRAEEKLYDANKIYDDLKSFIEMVSGPNIFTKLKNKTLLRSGYINTNNALDEKRNAVDIASWLMPTGKVTTPADNASLNKKIEKYDGLGYIETVYEEDNHRLGIIKYTSKSYYGTPRLRKLVLLNHADALFNYMDAGKLVIINKHSSYEHNGTTIIKSALLGKILFTDESTVMPESRVLDYMVEHVTGTDTHMLDDSQVKLFVKKCVESDLRKKSEEMEKTILSKKLKEKISSLNSGKEILLNNMNISNNQIIYEKQVLKRTDSARWVPSFLNDLIHYYSFDDINFDAVFNKFISECSATNSSGIIGDVAFKIIYKELTNKINIINTTTYVNGKRINKIEIQDCLRRAICYTNQKDFDEFLENVSTCSLKFHRYLQTGVEYEVHGLRHTEGFHFKLPLERKKNIMYIVLGEHEYKVKNTNRLIDMQRSRDLGEIMELLLNDKVIEGLNIADAKDVLKLAKFEYQDAILKSEKLLNETEKTLKLIKQHDIKMNETVVKEGYIINGKMRQYVVANTDKCEVYEYPSGRYICIVDKSTSQVGKDRLINRLYALVNDRALAQDIHTLK